ncbi:MAG: hypothetical protein RBU37_19085 [Myxococcota bacterium]|nr:hypothetical protein [Myxococcota bacterium]
MSRGEPSLRERVEESSTISPGKLEWNDAGVEWDAARFTVRSQDVVRLLRRSSNWSIALGHARRAPAPRWWRPNPPLQHDFVVTFRSAQVQLSVSAKAKSIQSLAGLPSCATPPVRVELDALLEAAQAARYHGARIDLLSADAAERSDAFRSSRLAMLGVALGGMLCLLAGWGAALLLAAFATRPAILGLLLILPAFLLFFARLAGRHAPEALTVALGALAVMGSVPLVLYSAAVSHALFESSAPELSLRALSEHYERGILNLRAATVRAELRTEAVVEGELCSLAPVVDDAWTVDEPVLLWAACRADEREQLEACEEAWKQPDGSIFVYTQESNAHFAPALAAAQHRHRLRASEPLLLAKWTRNMNELAGARLEVSVLIGALCLLAWLALVARHVSLVVAR